MFVPIGVTINILRASHGNLTSFYSGTEGEGQRLLRPGPRISPGKALALLYVARNIRHKVLTKKDLPLTFNI